MIDFQYTKRMPTQITEDGSANLSSSITEVYHHTAD